MMTKLKCCEKEICYENKYKPIVQQFWITWITFHNVELYSAGVCQAIGVTSIPNVTAVL